jgi:hypothetical protein
MLTLPSIYKHFPQQKFIFYNFQLCATECQDYF